MRVKTRVADQKRGVIRVTRGLVGKVVPPSRWWCVTLCSVHFDVREIHGRTQRFRETTHPSNGTHPMRESV